MKSKNAFILVLMLCVALGLAAISYYGIGAEKSGSAAAIKQGLDLSGGVYIVYEAQSEAPKAEEMEAAISMIQQRLDDKGWTEAEVAQEGTKRIRVEIPGVEDAEQAIEEIGETAHLTFCYASYDDEGTFQVGEVAVDGANVTDAYKTTSANNGVAQIVVSLEFDDIGREGFAKATGESIGQPIAILMDETIISAPTVQSAITDGKAIITGDFTNEEADALASKIRAGALPFKLEVMEYNTVGARLGATALETSLFAGVIGIFLVLVFMLLFYRISGVAADLALAIYTGLVIVIMSLLKITLTLPGIAGIILSIGMAVDANVIIFERIKEEIATGKAVRLAIQNGFSRALPAIIDGNVTTLISCVVLWWLGSGPVQGFAQTLMIGIIVSMFTAIFVSRVILNALVGVGLNSPKLYGGK